MTKVWVYSDVSPDGKPHPVALELLTKARDLGDEVAAVALGPRATGAAQTLGEYGAQTVFGSDDEAYAEHPNQPRPHAPHQPVQQHQPDLTPSAKTNNPPD